MAFVVSLVVAFGLAERKSFFDQMQKSNLCFEKAMPGLLSLLRIFFLTCCLRLS